MVAEWHYLVDGKPAGPVELGDLLDKLRSGQLSRNILVWKHGMPNWLDASTIPELAIFPPPPPSSASQIHNAGRAPQGGVKVPYHGAPARGLFEAFSVCMSNFFTFSGRASRSEYWYFMVWMFLINFVAGVLDRVFPNGSGIGLVDGIVTLIFFFPWLSAQVRRLHDINRSGWWIGVGWLVILLGWLLLMTLVTFLRQTFGASIRESGISPAIGIVFILGIFAYFILMLFFLCRRGTNGPNSYG